MQICLVKTLPPEIQATIDAQVKEASKTPIDAPGDVVSESVEKDVIIDQ